jgi:hypothetical protein
MMTSTFVRSISHTYTTRFSSAIEGYDRGADQAIHQASQSFDELQFLVVSSRYYTHSSSPEMSDDVACWKRGGGGRVRVDALSCVGAALKRSRICELFCWHTWRKCATGLRLRDACLCETDTPHYRFAWDTRIRDSSRTHTCTIPRGNRLVRYYHSPDGSKPSPIGNNTFLSPLIIHVSIHLSSRKMPCTSSRHRSPMNIISAPQHRRNSFVGGDFSLLDTNSTFCHLDFRGSAVGWCRQYISINGVRYESCCGRVLCLIVRR